MKIKTKLQCPGCKLETAVAFKYPNVIGAEIVHFKCGSCESSCMARVFRATREMRKTSPTQKQELGIRYAVKITQKSSLLETLEKQEAEEAAKTPEQKDAELVQQEVAVP